VSSMADASSSKHGVVIDPRVLLAGGAVATLGVIMLAAFLWMVPTAAERETKAACRGLRGDLPLSPALCGGAPCKLPVAAPNFTALDHQGKPVQLSDFRGKVVLLNFWASWCGVCKTEKPSIEKLANELGGDDLVVITLASDHQWSEVLLALVASLAPGTQLPPGEVTMTSALDVYRRALPRGIPFKVFIDPPSDDGNIGAITKSWGIKAVPESALIDRQGNIRAYFVNKRDWSTPVAQTCLRSVLEE
jgi:thiol-disulfide isomerase/thioredoxin